MSMYYFIFMLMTSQGDVYASSAPVCIVVPYLLCNYVLIFLHNI
jgi:hypothetical protein